MANCLENGPLDPANRLADINQAIQNAIRCAGASSSDDAILVESGPASKISGLPAATHALSPLDFREGVPAFQIVDDVGETTFLDRNNLLGSPLVNSTSPAIPVFAGTTSLAALEFGLIEAGTNADDSILQLQNIAGNYQTGISGAGAKYTIVMHGETGDSVQISANADDNINLGALDGDQGGSLTTTTNGSSVTLAADGTGHTWNVVGFTGTWSQTTAGTPRIISDQGGGGGVVVAVAGAATVNARAGTIQSEALTGATTYTLVLTNSYITTGPPASTVIVNLTDSANQAVALLTKTVANGHVTVTMSMTALTGTVKIDYAVFN